MNEKQQIVRSPEPGVRAAREAEERRRVAEIARDIQELGRALEGRDRQARFGTAVRAKSSLAQAGQTATGVEDGSTPEPESLPTGRATKTAQDAHRGAVAEMQRLTAWKNTETEAAARQGAEEKALGEEANRKAAEEKLAAVAAAPREDARQVADEKARAEAAREMAEAQARAATLGAAKRQTAEDARLKAEEAARTAAEGNLKADAEAKEQGQRAEATLAKKVPATRRSNSSWRPTEMTRRCWPRNAPATRFSSSSWQLAGTSRNCLAQKRARNQALEQQLAAHRNDQKLLPAPARDKLPTAPLPASDKPVMPADHKALTLTARPTAPEAERLMVQARLLLDQGKIIAARSVLERATESGSTLALFLLAETYDTAILSAWEIFGRHGDVKKAQELYTNAVAGGVHEAKHRLSALR